MTEEIQDRVLNLNCSELDPIVQAVLDDETSTSLVSLSCQSMGAPSVGARTLTIGKINGKANTSGGSKPWPAVVKAIDTSQTSKMGDNSLKEIATYESGLLKFGGRSMRAARCSRVERLPERHVWLWLEGLSEWIGPP